VSDGQIGSRNPLPGTVSLNGITHARHLTETGPSPMEETARLLLQEGLRPRPFDEPAVYPAGSSDSHEDHGINPVARRDRGSKLFVQAGARKRPVDSRLPAVDHLCQPQLDAHSPYQQNARMPCGVGHAVTFSAVDAVPSPLKASSARRPDFGGRLALAARVASRTQRIASDLLTLAVHGRGTW